MTETDDLLARCEALGVQTRYSDQMGDDHVAPVATLRALRQALERQRLNDAASPQVYRFGTGALSLPVPTADGVRSWKLLAGDEVVRQGALPPDATALELPDPPEPGIYRLDLGADFRRDLIVTPNRAYLPTILHEGGKVWGLATQLFALRSERNWGIGDFSDLLELIDRAARMGAAAIGLTPLHALFPESPERCSPYSPSSRLFLNELYLDPEAMPEYASCLEAQKLRQQLEPELSRLRATEMVDYAGVSAGKHRCFRLLYRHFRETHLASGNSLAQDFAAFRRRAGTHLERFTIFQALSAHFTQAPARYLTWRHWPEAYRRVDSAEVVRFARDHAEEIGYFAYLQWHTDRQLRRCRVRARRMGMLLGIYLDIAVGVDGDSAETWWSSGYLMDGWSIGAPPDNWNMKGQSWGAPPPNPARMRATGYAEFRAILQANMRAAGAVRIDHILGLMRLFWVPGAGAPAEGAYVRYPFEELLAIVTLESQRHRCVVIGEDLGTVPEGFADHLREFGVLSYRLLYFEQDQRGFRAPADWPRHALAAASTHDLPTLPAYWSGADLELRQHLDLYPSAEVAAAERARRVTDRERLVAALRREDIPAAIDGPAPVAAIYRYLARSSSMILMLQPEDLLGITAPLNVPGTASEYPNWRRKLPVTAEGFFNDPEVKSTFAAIDDEGRRPQTAPQRTLRVAPLTATYRLQFSRNFTFADATRLVPYLKALGISHLYASPYLKARPGSTHGYDITDHNALNPEIGTEDEFEALCAALREAGMGQILDFVPNHMGIGHADNAAWLDTLEWGPASPFARYFDINWRPRQPGLQDKVMVPLLGDHYGHALERGELKLGFDRDGGSFSIQYFEHRFPINPSSYVSCLPAGISEVPKHIDRADGQRLKRALIDQARDNAWLARLDRELKAINGVPGTPQSFRRLHDLLERQHYRLAYWRVAADEINYRRFFDINELAGLRIENADVFDAIHRLMRRLIQEGKLQGLRLDHIDGLRDPGQYLSRLRDVAAETTDDFYIVVEKILARHERLREDWPIDGTTGYECINLINGLFVDPDGLRELDRTYRRFLDRSAAFDEILYACKLLIIDTIMSSELHRLAGELDAISELHWSTRDYTQERLHAALREVVAGFPVYRTYVSERGVSLEDRRDIAWAVSQASKTYSGPDPEILDFIQAALTLDLADRDPAFDRSTVLRFALRFQQYTGPVMAKSLEDTGFYRYNRLLSLNEVGSDPRQPTVSPAAFHRMMEERAKTWPRALTTLSTHDTKRGADLRARLNVLSELASEWNQRVRRWASLNRYKRGKAENSPAPSPNDEYAIYQTLAGAWPVELVGRANVTEAEIALFVERLQGAVLKSIREAKRHTSWSSPNAGYESACRNFVQRLLERDRPNPFLNDFIAFQARLSRQGVLNSLSQAAIALLMPGVPDIYQGSETWDLSMVDPDNRRPIDFAQRQDMFAGITSSASDMLATWQDGRIKLALFHRLLRLRADQPDLFCAGSYEPIVFSGPLAPNLVGFARRQRERFCIVIASRLVTALSDTEGRYRGAQQWRGTEADLSRFPAALTDVLTGEIRPNDSPLATFLADLPVAILLGSEGIHFRS